MDENSKKEEFSYGYIHLLASICGYIIYPSKRAEDNFLGIDLHIIDSDESLDNAEAPRIFSQLKCTTQKYFYEEEEFFKYDLEIRNYNQLRKESLDPNILILVIVSENIEDWMVIREAQQNSLINGCAYWASLKGMRETSNTEKIRIKIPKTNLLTPVALQKIMRNSLENRKKLFDLQKQIEGDATE